jgi:hypothetical protein
MAIYEIQPNKIAKIKPTTFKKQGIKERADLQRLLRAQIDVVAPDTLIIAEEYSDWTDANRRIDLLGVDKDANLVVFELKCTETGGHMDLQAIRYAAMVSTMTFEKAVDAYADYLQSLKSKIDAEASLLEFLNWEEPDEENFAQDVRIVLVSADFSKEITTAVLWLNTQGLDIRCVRMKLYQDGKKKLVDVQQVIPLPETEEYIVQIKEKAEKEKSGRKDRTERHQLREAFWGQLLELSKPMTKLYSKRAPNTSSRLNTSSAGMRYYMNIRKYTTNIQISSAGDKTQKLKAIKAIHKHRKAIEKAFGGRLRWECANAESRCYIACDLDVGGYRTEKDKWSEIHNAMIGNLINMDKVLRPHFNKLPEKQ